MQHEPVRNDDHSCEDAELAHRCQMHTKPAETQERKISQRREGYSRADLAEAKTNAFWYRVVEGNREDSLCLPISLCPFFVLTKADMFSAPTTTITNGSAYVGNTV